MTRSLSSAVKAKGYPDSWIEKRMRSIAIREELTDEWQQRGIDNMRPMILSCIISHAKFYNCVAKCYLSVILNLLNRKALAITEAELKLMAKAAIMGLKTIPVQG